VAAEFALGYFLRGRSWTLERLFALRMYFVFFVFGGVSLGLSRAHAKYFPGHGLFLFLFLFFIFYFLAFSF
jgi:hypothetical protein